MEEYIGTISVPAIAVAVWFVLKLISYAVGKNSKYERFVPLISAGLGVVFGIVCFYALPSIIPAKNVVIAIVIGAASGFTAIGAGQMMKGLSGKTNSATQAEPPTAEPVAEPEEIEERPEELKDNKNSDKATTAAKSAKAKTSAKPQKKKTAVKTKTTKTNKPRKK